MGRKPKPDLPQDLIAILERVGANLREHRLEVGLTQSALASQSKVSATTINEIETRRFRDIRISTLAALAVPLKLEVTDFLAHSDVKLSTNDQARLLKASEDIVRITRKIRGE